MRQLFFFVRTCVRVSVSMVNQKIVAGCGPNSQDPRIVGLGPSTYILVTLAP